MKRAILIQPDGTETVLKEGPILPTYAEMKAAIGGMLEIPRVLRVDLPGFVYTRMVVDEEGLCKELPRNELATRIYQENTRRAYPNEPKPFEKAREEERKAAEAMRFAYINLLDNIEGFDPNDPHIAGPAIYFDGWTEAELLEAGL